MTFLCLFANNLEQFLCFDVSFLHNQLPVGLIKHSLNILASFVYRGFYRRENLSLKYLSRGLNEPHQNYYY